MLIFSVSFQLYGMSPKGLYKETRQRDSRTAFPDKKKPTKMIFAKNIAKPWRDLSGLNHWENMLDPLNIDLRRFIIHYGEMAQATYDAFNTNKISKYHGSSLYKKEKFFSHVHLDKRNLCSNYRVTKFLYATSSVNVPEAFIVVPASSKAVLKESNWMGYVAVATDKGKEVLGRRDIVVSWRGTISDYEWKDNFKFGLVSPEKILGKNSDALVHQGWYSIYTSDNPDSSHNKTSVRDQILSEIKRLVDLYNEEEIGIIISGHSLGASLATLNAIDIVANGYNISPNPKIQSASPVTATLFASPLVGDSNFKKAFSSYNYLRALRVRNISDIVPELPPFGYSSIGEELVIDTQKSKFLKSTGSISTNHNLEVYLHGVAGTQGKNRDFKLEINRSISLINKSTDALNDEYLVPVEWMSRENKGMVQEEDGSWKFMETEDCDSDV